MQNFDPGTPGKDFNHGGPRELRPVEPGSAQAVAVFSVLAGLLPILCIYPLAAFSLGSRDLSPEQVLLLDLGWMVVMVSPFVALLTGALNLFRMQGQAGLSRNLSILGCILGGLTLLAGLFFVIGPSM